jgi:hypothetical protein
MLVQSSNTCRKLPAAFATTFRISDRQRATAGLIGSTLATTQLLWMQRLAIGTCSFDPILLQRQRNGPTNFV